MMMVLASAAANGVMPFQLMAEKFYLRSAQLKWNHNNVYDFAN
jgi:hypothetical protein